MAPEFLGYEFMQRALAAGLIIGVISPLIGSFLVVRSYTRLADTLAHVALAGVAGGLIAGLDPVLGAVSVTVLAAAGVEALRAKGRMAADPALAIFLWGGLALAVVLISSSRGINADLFGYLFGSIATVGEGDLRVIALLGGIVVLFVLSGYRELFLLSWNEDLARASGISAGLFNYLLVLSAALTVAVSLRVVGLLLVGALMSIPVLAAAQVARSFRGVVLISICISLFSVVSGLAASYYMDLASGGTIVLVAVGVFVLSLPLGRKRA